MSEKKERHCWVLNFWGFFPNLVIHVSKSRVSYLRVLDWGHLFLLNLKELLEKKISLKVVSSQSIFYLRSSRNGRFFLSQFFLEVSPSAPSLPAGCIPVSWSLGPRRGHSRFPQAPASDPFPGIFGCAEWWCTQRVGLDLECVQGTHPEPWACQAGTAIEDY